MCDIVYSFVMIGDDAVRFLGSASRSDPPGKISSENIYACGKRCTNKVKEKSGNMGFQIRKLLLPLNT